MKNPFQKIINLFHEKTESPLHITSRTGKLRAHDTADPDVARDIFKQRDAFRTPTFVKKAMGQFIGKALILDEDESWKYTHDLIADIFSRKGVSNSIAPVIVEECDTMIDDWLKNGDTPIDAERAMRGLTARAVLRVTFGKTVDEKEGEAIIDTATVALESFRKPSGLTLLSRIFGMPYDHVPRMKKEYADASKKMDSILDGIITRRRKLNQQPDDILGRLINAKDLETGGPLSDKKIKDQLVMFIVAGHETTAAALTFALDELLKNPEEIEKIRRETDGVTKGNNVKPDDFNNLPSACNAFKEALRLHPTAYEIGREALENTTAGGREFKKGDLVRIDIRKMHKSPDIWDEPESFKPARFEKSRFPLGYIPFGGGGRTCLGMTMALQEGTLTLAEIFNRVKLKAVRTLDGEEPAFTMRPKGKLEVIAAPRRKP